MENDTFEFALERLTEEVRNTVESELRKRYAGMAVIAFVLMAGIVFLIDSLMLSNSRAELALARKTRKSVSETLSKTLQEMGDNAKLVVETQRRFEQQMIDASESMTTLSQQMESFQKEVKAVTDSNLLVLADMVDELNNISDVLEKTIRSQNVADFKDTEETEGGEAESAAVSPRELVDRIQNTKKSLARSDSSISAGLKVTEEW